MIISSLLLSVFIISTLSEESKSINWFDVLHAEATCCPVHVTQEQCDSETGSSCVFIADPQDPIAIAGGSQCLGNKYVECKQADINACCAPTCPGNQPAPAPPGQPAPAPPSPPECGPVPTNQPTPAPTTGCKLGVNYMFEGSYCVMSGDPHTTMFNGDRHDFQGTPTVEYQGGTMGELKNQFYYIHPCQGVSGDEMPIKVAATHYHWGTRSVSGVDYLVIILTENGGANKYYVYLSSALHHFADASSVAVPTDYDIAVAKGANLGILTSGAVPTELGRRFKVYYTQIEANKRAQVRIVIDGKMEFKAYMAGQTSWVDRYRMHYIQLTMPSELKCYSCGLCGNFMDKKTGLQIEYLEGCDGNKYPYKAGWNPDVSPVAYDTDGITWEKFFVDNDCSAYDVTDNIQDAVTNPCPTNAASKTAEECQKAINAQSTCCTDIGGTFCTNLLNDCKVDACAAAADDSKPDGVDLTILDEAINNIIIKAITIVCNNDELKENQDAVPLPALQCPVGSVVVATNANNDIPGCGLTSCDDRYSQTSIEECEAACQQREACNGFTWAPLNGDKNHQGKAVCTLYSATEPTGVWGPSQIFCAIAPKTCTLTAYTMADDYQYVFRSDGGGYTELNKKEAWGQTITTVLPGVTTNTKIQIKVKNNGGPGGFIAKFVLSNDNEAITTTETIYSNQPLTTMSVTTDQAQQYQVTSFKYYPLGGGAWTGLTKTTRPDYVGSIWTHIDSYTTRYYNLNLANFAEAFQKVGCVVRAGEKKENVAHLLANIGDNKLRGTVPASLGQDIYTYTEKSHRHSQIINNMNKESKASTISVATSSYYLEMVGIVGLILILCGAGFYFRSKRLNEYTPLKDVGSCPKEYTSFGQV